MSRFLLACATTLSLLGLAGSTQAGDPIIVHPDWGGIWDLDLEIGTCGQAGEQFSEVDTLCSGIPFEGDDVGLELDCTGSWTSTVIDITCQGAQEIFPDCFQTIVIEYDGTRNGETYGVTVITNITYAGTGTGCDSIPDTCQEENTNGDRTGPEPQDCATPIESVSWGAIKVRYR